MTDDNNSDNSLYDDLFDDIEIVECTNTSKYTPKTFESEIQVEEYSSQIPDADLTTLQEQILDSKEKFEAIKKRRMHLDEIIIEVFFHKKETMSYLFKLKF